MALACFISIQYQIWFGDKMKSKNTIVLSGIAILLIAMFTTNVAIADTVPDEAGPGDDLQVYFLKKSFDFCDDGIHPHDGDGDMPGGSVPDGFDVQSSGCVDRWTNEGTEQDRRDNYAFTGEQIAELVVARDLDGAIAITHAILMVDGDEVAYCNELPYYQAGGQPISEWRGHEVAGILAEYPPQKSESTAAGFNPLYDKLFECILTVTDDMDGESIITVEVMDVVNDMVAATDDQMWFFNPEVSLDISLTDGSAVMFEDGYAGDIVYSTNKLLLANEAEGGVDIAVWLGGTDLTSPSMAAKCPWSNVLDVEGISVDGHDYNGMEFRCNLDNGLYIEQCWQQIKNKNIKLDCDMVSEGDGDDSSESCAFSHEALCLGINPLFQSIPNVLENGHEADCMFKLQYPVPCIGDFTDGNLVILMRAI